MQKTTSITIPERFAGPPLVANGGYVAGLLAERAGVRAAHVELRSPVPLEQPVEVTVDDPGATVSFRGRVLATAAPAWLLDMSHPSVDFVSAALSAGEADPNGHPFPGCFVCGPERSLGDGMHLFPGKVGDGVVAVPWQPTPWQADPTGTVPARMVAAALDCPSAFAALGPGSAALLASMTFRINRLPLVGEHLVVTGWERGSTGRKISASTAIATADGETLARSDTLWIAVDDAKLALIVDQMQRMAA
jgi:hypothetical protein